MKCLNVIVAALVFGLSGCAGWRADLRHHGDILRGDRPAHSPLVNDGLPVGSYEAPVGWYGPVRVRLSGDVQPNVGMQLFDQSGASAGRPVTFEQLPPDPRRHEVRPYTSNKQSPQQQPSTRR